MSEEPKPDELTPADIIDMAGNMTTEQVCLTSVVVITGALLKRMEEFHIEHRDEYGELQGVLALATSKLHLLNQQPPPQIARPRKKGK